MNMDLIKKKMIISTGIYVTTPNWSLFHSFSYGIIQAQYDGTMHYFLYLKSLVAVAETCDQNLGPNPDWWATVPYIQRNFHCTTWIQLICFFSTIRIQYSASMSNTLILVMDLKYVSAMSCPFIWIYYVTCYTLHSKCTLSFLNY